ncbi:SigB/SigF/SigG family RNA polymerase sigma factor [Butyricicoccus porcorum]|uniref:SigB/SigF/SigG family RNA polymerase sigma factor n=1 Tax=Butyricicoccus porcorum TaxID=1945634 RepID=UPI002985E19F|nr:SigB/SigF/SigG family RNA polymerase sigma factor [Butyricicoccus porcorum]MDY4483768.1 SigB/SigF/SigG family RNA polymerase sigma factor [Butyricicoccus porcorum]
MDRNNAAEQLRLIRRAQAGEEDACETLIRENSGLIWSIVRRYAGRGVDMEDLYQLGSLGFVKAVQGFDCEYGTRFSTYAVPKISGEIRRFLRDNGTVKVSRTIKSLAIRVNAAREQLSMKTGREPTISELSELLDASPEEIAACESALVPTDSLQREIGDDGATLEHLVGDDGIEEKVLESVLLRDSIHRLNEKEQKVILLRYFRSQTQQQCAAALGISQVQVSRLERRAIEHMREMMTEA